MHLEIYERADETIPHGRLPEIFSAVYRPFDP